MDAGDFVLPVDKPEGPTSHDVVARARKALGTRKIGHTGTLDPFATGLLVLCVGRATRLSEYLTGLDKSYVAEARLGVRTDTLDRDGVVLAEHDGWSDLTEVRIGEALRSFLGEVDQVPPQFSAKKVGGEAMHRRARRGETVELVPVRVTIHDIELLQVELPSVTFRVRCSTGTYVRAIARDLGDRLDVGAHLTGLRRIRVGPFDVADAVEVDRLDDGDAVASARVEPARALSHMRRVEVDADESRRLRHGQRIRPTSTEVGGGVTDGPTPSGAPGEPVAAMHESELVAAVHEGDLVAVARLDHGVLEPRKVFPA